jgi:hypothetical protein
MVAEFLQAGRVVHVPQAASPLLRRFFFFFLLAGLVFFLDLIELLLFCIGQVGLVIQSGTWAYCSLYFSMRMALRSDSELRTFFSSASIMAVNLPFSWPSSRARAARVGSFGSLLGKWPPFAPQTFFCEFDVTRGHVFVFRSHVDGQDRANSLGGGILALADLFAEGLLVAGKCPATACGAMFGFWEIVVVEHGGGFRR